MSDQVQALETQNAARRDAVQNHNSTCGPLVWDDQLANNAKAWAEHLAQIGQMVHSSGDQRPGQGENLYSYMGTNATPNFNDAAVAWCNEKPQFPGGNFGNGNWEAYGHYSQVVWPSTTKVGMGIAQGSNGWFYVCGRYSPTGNFSGEPVWGPGGTASPGHPSNPAPPPHYEDGVYLVNSVKDGQWSSGFAWYAKMGDNTGHQPDFYMDIHTGGTIHWEGQTISGVMRGNNTFKCSVNNVNWQSTPVGQVVGHANNNFRTFVIEKDDNRVLYTIDGWQVHAIYKCL